MDTGIEDGADPSEVMPDEVHTLHLFHMLLSYLSSTLHITITVYSMHVIEPGCAGGHREWFPVVKPR